MTTSRSFVIRLISGAVILNMLIYFIVGLSLYQIRQQYEKQTELSTQNLAKSLEASISFMIERTDTALFNVVGEIERQLVSGGVNEKILNTFFIKQHSLNTDLEGLRFVDANGDVKYGTNIPANKKINIADREYFRYLLSNTDAGLVISKPIIGRITGVATLIVARRVNYPNGSFAGIVFGVLPIKYFYNLFSNIDVGKNGSIALRNNDLEIILRYPDSDKARSAIGNKEASEKGKEWLKSGATSGTYIADVKFDNIERTLSFRKIEKYSMYIIAAQASRDYLASWNREVAVTSSLLLLFTVFSIVFSRVIIINRMKDKAALETLQKSESQFRILVDTIPDLVWLKNADGVYLTCNKMFERFFGASEENIVGKTDYDFVNRELADFFRDHDRKAMAAGVPTSNEEWVTFADDKHEALLLTTKTPMYNSDGTLVGVLGIGRDITESKQSEKAIRASEQKLSRIFATMSDAFVSVDMDGYIKEFNFAYLEMLGYEADEIQGLTYMDITPEKWHDMEASIIKEKVLVYGSSGVYQKEYCRKDGVIIPVELRASLFWGSDGNPSGMMAIVRDITERKQAESEFLNIQKNLLEAQRIAQIGNWELNLLDNNLTWSDEIFRIFEIDKEKFKASYNAFLEAIHPEDREAVDAAYINSLENRMPYEISHRLLMPDGRIKFVYEQCRTYFDSEGRPLSSIGTVQDITELKQAENELRKSEEKFAKAFRSSSDIIAITTMNDGRIIEVNDRVKELLGYTREEVIGKTSNELNLFSDKSQRGYFIAAMLRDGYVHNLDVKYIAKSGKLIDTQVSGEFIELQGVKCMLVTIRDITARKIAEERMLLLNKTIDVASDGVYWMDLEGKFIYVNDSACTMLGYSRDELLELNVYDINPKVTEERWASLWEKIRVDKNYFSESVHCRKDGSTFPVEIVSTYLKFGDKEFINGFARDITERKKVDAELKEYRDNLEKIVQSRTNELLIARDVANAANRAKSIFLANMSHEIRTPLNAVLGFAQLLERDSSMPPQALKNVSTILKSGDHLLAIINDILEMARIESGRVEIQLKSIDLHSLLDDLAVMFHMRANEKGLMFTIDMSGNLPRYITTDLNKLRQILINLIGNAVKFTNTGSIELNAFPEGSENIAIEIKDTGIGISSLDQGKIFSPFERTHSGEQAAGGTGLGLAISREYAHMLGGDITVVSDEGKGSSFHFVFNAPAAFEIPDSSYSSDKVTGIAQGQGEVRVLVVDDMRANRELLRMMLEPLGFIVDEASNGKESIEKANSLTPRIILMDMVMPDMDGAEATRIIRSTYTMEQLAIIGISASVFDVDRQNFIDAGINAFIAKPFREQELYDVLGTHAGVLFETERDKDYTKIQTDNVIPDINKMPIEWRGNFRDSLNRKNITRLRKLGEDAKELDPVLSAWIIEKVLLYDIDGLKKLDINLEFESGV